jgi:hypothetical protein
VGSAWVGGSGAHFGFGTGSFPVELPDAAETCAHTSEQRVMDGKLRLCQAVVGELPIAGDLYQACPMEVAEVARDGRLRKRKELDKVADAQLAGDEHIQDPNPSRVGEAAEEEIEICDRISGLWRHAWSRSCVCGYNLAKRM